MRWAILPLCALWLPREALAVGHWTAMANTASDNIGICLLLTDGTILAEGSGATWYKLSPDSSGHYVNGAWSARSSSSWGHQTGSTAVLQSGNVFVSGGENGNGTNKVEIYYPSSDSWAVAVNPAYFGNIYDGNATLLPNGRVLIEPQAASGSYANKTFIFDPISNTFSQTAGAPLHGIGESSWVKLPNDNILVIDSNNSSAGATTAEQYNPSNGTWGNAQSGVPNVWPNVSGTGYVSEMGPAFMLPNGNAIFFGGNGATAVYNPSTGTWSSGGSYGGGLGQKDAPGAMMVNGKVLLAVSPMGVNSDPSAINGIGPTSFLEYDYAANGGAGGFAFAPNAPSGYSQLTGRAGVLFMLDLPDGTVLLSGFGNRPWIYQPDLSPLAAGKPTIYGITWNPDGSLHLTGTLFNGISQGAYYGDNSQMDSNYPLIRFTDGSGNVYYGTTYNWSSTSVQTGGATVSTDATFPVGLPAGANNLSVQVVANGIASDPWAFSGPIWVDFTYYSIFNFYFGTFFFPDNTIAKGVSDVSSGGTILIKNGSHSPETLTISKPMTIRAYGTPTTIGR